MYVCVCMYVCTYVCMCMYVLCMYVCVYVCMSVCTYVCMYIPVHMYTEPCIATPAQSARSLPLPPPPNYITATTHNPLPHCTALYWHTHTHNGTFRLNRIPTFRRSNFISGVDIKARRTVRSAVRDPTKLHRCESCRGEWMSERESTVNCRLSENGIIKCTKAITGINVHVSARERPIQTSGSIRSK